MIVSEFSSTYRLYEGFQVWEIESIATFFEGAEILSTIFKEFYHFPVEELAERRGEIPGTDLDIMVDLLTLVSDKSFFVFTLHDKNHLELAGMQQVKAMDFGTDITKIRADRVYAMIMDKQAK